MKQCISITLLITLTCIFSACSTMNPIVSNTPYNFDNIRQNVDIGDRLAITKITGEKIEISSVSAVTKNAVSSKDTKVFINDIQEIKKEEFNIRKTFNHVAWGTFIFLLIALP